MKIPNDILKRQQMAIEEALEMYKKSKFQNKKEDKKSSFDINLVEKSKEETKINIKSEVIKEEENHKIPHIELKEIHLEEIKQPIEEQKKQVSDKDTNTYTNINSEENNNLNKIDEILNNRREKHMKDNHTENNYNYISKNVNPDSKKKL